MATPKSQRIGIWVIAVVMLVGTIGSFAVMVLASDNDRKDQAEQQKLIEEYQKQMEEAQKEEQEKADKLSVTHYPIFKGYESSPKQFDPKKVGDDVSKKDLKIGAGTELRKGDNYQVYYIGWNPDGKVFDSSFDGASLKYPLDTTDPAIGGPTGLVEGWQEGVIGMKVGGVREITIPSELGYKDQDRGELLRPNTPMKFVMYLIEIK